MHRRKSGHGLHAAAPAADAAPGPMALAFQPGWRFSALDAAVLVLGSGAAVAVARLDGALGGAVAFTVSHFFFFCNVLRMDRALELAWAVVFVLLAASTLWTGVPPWWGTFAATLVCTCGVALLQLRKPSYHGVLWEVVNPDLPQWWQAAARGDAPASSRKPR